MTRPPDSRRVVAALAFASFGYGIMQSLVTPLLPMLRDRFDTSAEAIGWLMSGFLLTACIASPVAGRLGDTLGRAKVLRGILLVYLAGTLLAIVAPGYGGLLAARLIQGVGGALFPLAYGILRSVISSRAVAGSIGLMSSMTAVGSGAGLVVVGPLAAWGGVPAIFAGAALVVGPAVVWVFRLVPVEARRPGTVGVAWVNVAWLAAWLTPLLAVISQLVAPTLPGPVIVGAGAWVVLALAVWIRLELRASAPIVPLALMRSSALAWANALACGVGTLLFAVLVVMPTFVQARRDHGGMGASVAETAAYMLPQTVMFLLAGLGAGAMSRWPGTKVCLVLGAALSLTGGSLLLTAHATQISVMLAIGVFGTGIGLSYTHVAAGVVASVDGADASAAAGLNANARSIGGALGIQAGSAFAGVGLELGDFGATFGGLTALALLAIPLAIGAARRLSRA